MIDIACQLRENALFPYSEEDQEALKTYHPNQILRAKITGAEKPRSYEQLKLYWACCNIVALNLENTTKEDIDFEVKIRIAKEHPSMIKRFVAVDGKVYMEPISIAYANMKALDANDFFNMAFPILASMIGVDVETLVSNVDF